MLQALHRRFATVLRFSLLPALVLLGCATTTDLPPITTKPSSSQLPGKFIWHDLLTSDPDAARRFYGGLFGWSFKDVSTADGTYTLISNRGMPIGGLIHVRSISGGSNPSRWVGALSVTDVDRAVKVTVSDGGTVYQPPTEVTGRGRIAVIGDPLGAVLTLVSSVGGDPRDQPTRAGDWVWDELWTNYPRQASAFYVALVANYGVRIRHSDGEEAQRLLTSQGRPRSGILVKPVPQMPHTWIGYIRVADPESLAEVVPELGGKVLLAPRENPAGNTVAMFSDPTGAGFLVQSWPTDGPTARPHLTAHRHFQQP